MEPGMEFFDESKNFEVFNKCGQSPDTVQAMDEYFAPDFEFHPYGAAIIRRSLTGTTIIKLKGLNYFWKCSLPTPWKLTMFSTAAGRINIRKVLDDRKSG
jgi:hypothetical protein